MVHFYIRPKSLIPVFCRFLCYLTAKYLEKLKNQKIARIWMLLPCLAIIIYIYLKKDDVKSEVLWKLLLLGCGHNTVDLRGTSV